MQPPSPDMEEAYLKNMRQTALFVRGGVVLGVILLVFTLGFVVNISQQTKEATEVNRRLIERGNPCVAGDPPTSEACVAKAAADQRLAEALRAVQAQHDAQAAQIDDAVARLIELQERQHGSIPNAGARPPARPATRTTVAPRTTTTSAATPGTTTATSTTSTTTCVPHKRERCK